MTILFSIQTFILGMLFWSFASVIIYRLKSGESGALLGRSHCPHCQNTLQARHLIPIISWIIQRWKCAFCKKSIPKVYPLLELSCGFIFMFISVSLIDPLLLFSGNILEIGRFIFFLSLAFLSIVYVWYDILFLEIPESVLALANILVFFWLFLQSLGYEIFPYLPSGNFFPWDLILALCVVAVLYVIFLAELKEIYDSLLLIGLISAIIAYMQYFDISIYDSALLSGTLAALWVYISFFLQIVLSQGRAMGWGDLRIAILMGAVCGASLVIPAWIICYTIGSIIGVWLIIFSKIRSQKKENPELHVVPFGPFIASGYIAVLLFYTQIWTFLHTYYF